MKFSKEKLKLLMILPSTARGGAEEYALTIARAAVEESWDVQVAFPKRETTEVLVQSFEAQGVSYYPLEIQQTNLGKFKTLKTYLLHLTRTICLLVQNKPDVVQIILPWPEWCFGSLLACGLLKIPTAVVFQLIPFHTTFSTQQLKAYAWARARKQQWIAVSEHNRKVIADSFQMSCSELLCIYNGAKKATNANKFKQEETVLLRHQIRQELKLPETSRLALTVGRLDSQKGHTDLIPAIPYLVEEFPDLRFIWVGDGQEREYLAEKLREYGVEDKVFFLGYRSDVPKLLVSTDIFVFPTRYEGQPFALMEAMAHGLPIITSNASGIPELIEDRVQGLVFRTGDSCGLLEAIRWALRHPEQMQHMAMKAKLRAQECSEEKMIQKTLHTLHKMAHIFTVS